MAVAQTTLAYGAGGQATKQEPGTLYEGSQGEGVKALQQRLTDLGYDVGGVDAIFGPKTAAELKKFQQNAGIQVDAIAGPQTMSALYGTTLATAAGKQALGGRAEDYENLAKGLGGSTTQAATPAWIPTVPSVKDIGANLQYRESDLVRKLNAVSAGEPVDNATTEAAAAQRVKDEAAATLKKKQDAIAAGLVPGSAEWKAAGGGGNQSTTTGQGAGGTNLNLSGTDINPGDASGLKGYTALKLSDLTGAFGEFAAMNKEAMAPYEGYLRDLLNRQPGYTVMTDEQILARAREQAGLAVGGQRTEITQGLEQQRQQAASRQQAVEAGYAGSQEAVNQALTEARRQATEAAIAQGGGRSGKVDWLAEKLQQPLMAGFQQQQAQRAASIAEIQQGLGLTEQQAAQRLEQLGQQEGQLTTQQAAALRDTEYNKGLQAWQAGLAGTMGLAGLAGQQNQANATYAMSLMPYLYGTYAERSAEVARQTELFNQQPGTAPGVYTGPSQGTSRVVPIRTYAASKGKGNLIDWDEATDTVRIGKLSLTHQQLIDMGGREENGIAYLPQETLNRLLGVV